MFQIKVAEKIKIHILCTTAFIENRARMWKNIVQPGRPQTTNTARALCMLGA
jgi:hypothetical protein